MSTPPSPHPNGHHAGPLTGPDNPSPTAELTALAAHLRRLADRVDDLDNRCGQLSGTLTELGTETATRLAEHSDQVQELLDTLITNRAGPNDWSAMTAEQATAAWNDLADWIAETLVPWYEITRDQLPDCWALHRPAVTQLAWLQHTHRAAHQPGAAPHLIAEWHTRWLTTAMQSVRDAIPQRGAKICGPGGHLVAETELARSRPGIDPLPRPMPGPRPPAGGQPAERGHWQNFYEQARAADLALRRADGTS